MTNSEFIASLIGPVLLAVSCSLLLNKDIFRRILDDIEGNMFAIVLAGITLLVAGITIVRVHNIWEGWPLVITLFGWLAIIGGIVRTIFAPRIQGFAHALANNNTLLNVAVVVTFLLGLFLTGKGFALF